MSNSQPSKPSHRRYVSRLLTVLFAFLGSCYASSVLLVLEADLWRYFTGRYHLDLWHDWFLWFGSAVKDAMTLALALAAPALVLIFYAEWKRINSYRYYLFSALLLTAVVYSFLLLSDSKLAAWDALLWFGLGKRFIVDAAIALIGGLLYWGLAGRKAGEWRFTAPRSGES